SSVLVVGRAARTRDTRAERARIGEHLVDESSLPKSGLADDRNDAALTSERLVERAHEQRDLFVAADERSDVPLGHSLVLALERTEDGEGRVLRALRMILLRLDRAKDRDHRVADVLLDQPALIADVRGDRVPGSAHVLVKLLGIEPLGE